MGTLAVRVKLYSLQGKPFKVSDAPFRDFALSPLAHTHCVRELCMCRASWLLNRREVGSVHDKHPCFHIRPIASCNGYSQLQARRFAGRPAGRTYACVAGILDVRIRQNGRTAPYYYMCARSIGTGAYKSAKPIPGNGAICNKDGLHGFLTLSLYTPGEDDLTAPLALLYASLYVVAVHISLANLRTAPSSALRRRMRGGIASERGRREGKRDRAPR